MADIRLYLNKIRSSIKKTDPSGNNMTSVVVRSSTISLVMKVIIILLGFATMPIVYNSLDKYQYGVYVTLTSIISWIDMFDFGIAAGLRNKLTEARVDGDVEKGRRYISTAYSILTIIASVLLLIYILFINHINWQGILNAKDLDSSMLNSMALWVFILFLVRFVASIIRNVYYAFQESYMVDVVQMIGKFSYLLVVILLVVTKEVFLFKIAVIQSAISALVPVLAAFHFFIFKERKYAPSLSKIDFKVSGDILGLGWQFFVIQIALLVIHSGNNLLISQFVDPASVPAYSLAYQLFSYALMVYTIIITPLWSAYTEAWKRGDTAWIKTTMNRMKKIFLVFAIGCILVVLLSPWIFRIWIGRNADVPMLMSFVVAVMMLIDMWTRIYDYFINGVGKMRVQMYANLFMAVINIPLAYYFSVVLNIGAIGVVLASIVSYSVLAIISPIQARMIINNTAKGVWNK